MVTWAMEINTDPSCNRNTDPDMALGIITGTNITMNPVAVLATQISVSSAAAFHSDTSIVSGG